PYFQNQLHERATGSTAQGIKASKLPQLLVVRPNVSEQESIVEQAGYNCAPLDTAISRLGREVELLREYRTRLIADVVTGKLDVRGSHKTSRRSCTRHRRGAHRRGRRDRSR